MFSFSICWLWLCSQERISKLVGCRLLNFAVIWAINSGRFCPGDRMHSCKFINLDKPTSWVSYKAEIQKLLLTISIQKHWNRVSDIISTTKKQSVWSTKVLVDEAFSMACTVVPFGFQLASNYASALFRWGMDYGNMLLPVCCLSSENYGLKVCWLQFWLQVTAASLCTSRCELAYVHLADSILVYIWQQVKFIHALNHFQSNGNTMVYKLIFMIDLGYIRIIKCL